MHHECDAMYCSYSISRLILLFPTTPLSGTYTTPQGKSYNSAFLGLQKMETEKRLNNGEADDSTFAATSFAVTLSHLL